LERLGLLLLRQESLNFSGRVLPPQPYWRVSRIDLINALTRVPSHHQLPKSACNTGAAAQKVAGGCRDWGDEWISSQKFVIVKKITICSRQNMP
jgi:hypothetical protein